MIVDGEERKTSLCEVVVCFGAARRVRKRVEALSPTNRAAFTPLHSGSWPFAHPPRALTCDRDRRSVA